MNTHNPFPDLAQSFEKMKIIESLRTVSDQTIFGCQIIEGVKDPSRWDELINDISMQAEDNFNMVEAIIGRKSLTLIIKYGI